MSGSTVVLMTKTQTQPEATEASLDALDLLAGLRMPDGSLWGDVAYSFQWEDARAVLDPTGPPFHFLTRARGGSKTTDLAAVAIVLLLMAEPRSRQYWLASDVDQGKLAIDAVGGFLDRTPYLRSLEVQTKRVINPATGSDLVILAADAPSVWGLNPSATFVDEIAQWATTAAPKRLWEAVSSAAAKRDDARLVVLTTAGDPAHWSYKLRQHALKDPLWRVNEVPGPPPWMSPVRIAEQERRLPSSSFQRLFQNQWTAAEDRLTNLDDLAACVVLDGPLPPQPGTRYVVGVDVGLRRDRTVACVCHAERLDGRPLSASGGMSTDADPLRGIRVVLDRIQVWAGSTDNSVRLSDVEAWLSQAVDAYNHARIVIDPWQAVGMAQRLRGRGVAVQEFNFTSASVGRLASALHQLLRNRALALPNDEALLDELANVRLRETTPGVYRLDHDPDQHDDRAIALGLAANQLLSRPVPRPQPKAGQF